MPELSCLKNNTLFVANFQLPVLPSVFSLFTRAVTIFVTVHGLYCRIKCQLHVIRQV